ncbi:hypothetical protein LINGRAHAP2_LOCUS5158, partial [Linum grandiflorum]
NFVGPYLLRPNSDLAQFGVVGIVSSSTFQWCTETSSKTPRNNVNGHKRSR